MGFSQHRFDIRWKTWKPDRKSHNNDYIKRSVDLAKAAHSQGLEPLVILSTPPRWAYRKASSKKLQQAFREYAQAVKHHFDAEGVPIQAIQVLNELNNPVYTPPRFVKELPALIDNVKDIFGPQTDVSATMVIAKPWTKIESFMERHRTKLSRLTSIGLDFYPGTYQLNKTMLRPRSGKIVSHQILEAVASKGMKNVRRDFLSLLNEQLSDIHEFSSAIQKVRALFPTMNIDLGEFGFPTLHPIQKRNPRHQILQRRAIQKISEAMLPVLNEHNVRKIGFYELFDDKEFGVLNWGIINDRGDAKHIAYHLPNIISRLRSTTTTKNN